MSNLRRTSPAADLVLADDEQARLDEVSRPPLLYPYWHQGKTARDRLSPADLTCWSHTSPAPEAQPVVTVTLPALE
jgi:hypothetical protein